jgi:chloramphenicol 3-O-phosphotransferase
MPLQHLEQARLRQDGRHDAHARGERERIHVPGILGLRHGHAQPAAFQRQGNRQVVARELGP